MGYWAVMRGVGLQHTRGLHGYPVNRWSTKRTPIDPKLDRRSTGAIPRPHAKPRSIPRMFNTRSRRNVKGDAGGDIGAPDCKTDNGKDARIYETNTYANVMHMMT